MQSAVPTLPTPCQHAPRKIAQLENRLVDLQEANRKRESQLLAKKKLLEGLERTRDRKRRTRRLILIGSVVEKDLADPNSDLRQRLDQALEKPKDRALFDLPSRSVSGPGCPLCSPLRMDPGQDHRRRLGSSPSRATPTPSPTTSKAVPSPSRPKSGKSWDATLPRSSSGCRTSSWSALKSPTVEDQTPIFFSQRATLSPPVGKAENYGPIGRKKRP